MPLVGRVSDSQAQVQTQTLGHGSPSRPEVSRDQVKRAPQTLQPSPPGLLNERAIRTAAIISRFDARSRLLSIFLIDLIRLKAFLSAQGLRVALGSMAFQPQGLKPPQISISHQNIRYNEFITTCQIARMARIWTSHSGGDRAVKRGRSGSRR